jgi:sulfite reductase alpha subunit-like flavoprotein
VTNWLAGLQQGSGAGDGTAGAGVGADCFVGGGSGEGVVQVPVWVDRGAFRLPPDESTPLLMVGPGTGVAPFRSFCWQRAALRQLQQQQQGQIAAEAGAAPSSDSSSSGCLFFGCRSPDADFYYEEEWWPIMQTGALHQQHGLVAAFSRHSPQPTQPELLQMLQRAAETSQQQDSGQQELQQQPLKQPTAASVSSSSRVYVTHKLREHGAAVWKLLSEQGGWVYVSGSAEKMPAGVVSALEDVAATHGGLSTEAAAKFVRQLELTGRYHVEAWS